MADLEHLHPLLRARALATGVPINSGARSREKQAWLIRCREDFNRTGVCRCPSAGCFPANQINDSWHIFDEQAAWPNPDPEASTLRGGPWALAVDFDRPYPHGAPGLCFPVPGEPHHAQLIEIPETIRTPDAWRRLRLPADFTDTDRSCKEHFAQLVGGI